MSSLSGYDPFSESDADDQMQTSEPQMFPLDLQPLPQTYVGFYKEWRKINPGNQARNQLYVSASSRAGGAERVS